MILNGNDIIGNNDLNQNITITTKESTIIFYFQSTGTISSSAIVLSLTLNPYSQINNTLLGVLLGCTGGVVFIIIVAIMIRICINKKREQDKKWEEETGVRYNKVIKGSIECQFNPKMIIYSQSKCTICLEEFDNTARIRQVACYHIFHKQCIDAWLNTKKNAIMHCPTCNVDLYEATLKHDQFKSVSNPYIDNK